jgi:hypothetical protein
MAVNGVGRPLKFEDPQKLEQKIEEYFNKCDQGEEVTEPNKRGELVTYTRAVPYTLEGLALYLDCETDTIRNYEKRDRFFGVISRARARIYESWLKGGMTGSLNPKIVALALAANYRQYNVRQEVNHRSTTIEDVIKRIGSQQQNREALPYPDVIDGELPE